MKNQPLDQLPTSKLTPFTITYPSPAEYRSLKNEIFTQDSYYFESATARPVIIDAGAHLGLATLYFKKLYPAAHITALEPHPTSGELLQHNLIQNGFHDVTLVRKALDSSSGTAPLYSDPTPDQWYSTASFSPGSWKGDQQTTPFQVQTTLLSTVIAETMARAKESGQTRAKIDCLKLDIEGAEQTVLEEAGENLGQIQHLFVEFHPGAYQSLSEVVALLKKFGFQVTLRQQGAPVQLNTARGLTMIEATRSTNA